MQSLNSRTPRRLMAWAFTGVLAASAFAPSAWALEKASVRLKWVPQTQFAGFYVAKAKGFYEAEGLDLTINPGGPNLNGETLVASGADDFALAGSIESLLTSREKGLPIVAVAMLLQTSPSAYVTFEDSGIKSPSDFKGRKVSTFFTGAHNMLFAVLASSGVPQSEVTVVPQAVSMAPFIDKQVDVATVMVFNELNVLKARGINNIKVLYPHDYGVNFPSDPIIVNEKLIAEKPKVVQGFLNATLKGWKYAIQNPDEAVDIVMKAAPGLDRAHQKAMLTEYGKIMTADTGPDTGLGYLNKPVLERAREILLERKVLKPDTELSKAINDSFWKAVPAADRQL